MIWLDFSLMIWVQQPFFLMLCSRIWTDTLCPEAVKAKRKQKKARFWLRVIRRKNPERSWVQLMVEGCTGDHEPWWWVSRVASDSSCRPLPVSEVKSHEWNSEGLWKNHILVFTNLELKLSISFPFLWEGFYNLLRLGEEPQQRWKASFTSSYPHRNKTHCNTYVHNSVSLQTISSLKTGTLLVYLEFPGLGTVNVL